MTPVDWRDATFADGAKVVEWLDARENLGVLDETDRKAIARWRDGSTATFRRVDQLLNRFGRHPSELPDAVWIEPRRRMRAAA